MNQDTRNFWLGCAWAVALIVVLMAAVGSFRWLDRYLQWEHVHPSHKHVHEHEPHEHPHDWPEHAHEVPEHSHPHLHHVQIGEPST